MVNKDEQQIKSNSLKKKLDLKQSGSEGLLIGLKKDGKKYSVREHRLNYFMPPMWIKVYDNLPKRAKITAQLMIQTGARINEVRHIEERDIDYDRNTIKLRITKTKAKKGEKKGKPRTIPINSKFIKQLKKHFKENKSIGVISTAGFNKSLKNTLIKLKNPEWYMFASQNIRKTHGNWLKIMGNLKIMEVDAMEICLRLGHDYNTFLKHYGSSGVADNKDILLIKQILGDLYQR